MVKSSWPSEERPPWTAEDDQGDAEGRRRLHWYAIKGRAERIATLVAQGAPVDVTDDRGNTPLHYAVWNRVPESVDALLAAGANPNAVNYKTQTPFHHACALRDPSFMMVLLKSGALFGQVDHKNRTPLMALAYPPPEGMRLRTREFTPDLIDLLTTHAPSEFWDKAVGQVWRQRLAKTEGADDACGVWARLEENQLRRNLAEAPPSSSRPAGSRRL